MLKSKKKNSRIKIVGIISICILLIIFIMFFLLNQAKTSKFGNNNTSQEIVNYILNINSYESKIKVTVNSNKSSNKYVLKQQYIKDKLNVQEVLEPNNIAGVRFIKENNKLTLENTNLNLSSIFKDYEYISENILDLDTFIENYKSSEESNFEEIDEKIVLNTTNKLNNRYIKYMKLYINKENGNPEKMIVIDNNKNVSIDIIYNEISIDTLQ